MQGRFRTQNPEFGKERGGMRMDALRSTHGTFGRHPGGPVRADGDTWREESDFFPSPGGFATLGFRAPMPESP